MLSRAHLISHGVGRVERGARHDQKCPHPLSRQRSIEMGMALRDRGALSFTGNRRTLHRPICSCRDCTKQYASYADRSKLCGDGTRYLLAITEIESSNSKMDQRDKELLEKQLSWVRPSPRRDGISMLLALAFFVAGLLLGSTLFAFFDRPMLMASNSSPAAVTIPMLK